MESTTNEASNTTQVLKKFTAQKIRNPSHNKTVAQLNLKAVAVSRLEEKISKLPKEGVAWIYDQCDRAVAAIMAKIIDEIAFDIACDRMSFELSRVKLFPIEKQLFVKRCTNSNFPFFLHNIDSFSSGCYCSTFFPPSKLPQNSTFESNID